jgi:STE24 endopeptidase
MLKTEFMHNFIYYAIIAIIIFDFIFERILDYLNTTRWSAKLPSELQGIYDEDEYRKSQEYEKTKHRFSLITGSLSFVVVLLMFGLGGFAFFDAIAKNWAGNPVTEALIFFGILGMASEILSLPFSLYRTFVIEEKFGFNKTTPRTFLLDKLKGLLITAIIGGGLLALIVWIYVRTQEMFWIYVLMVIGGFTIFMSMFYSNLIVPLFNKQTPLEEGDLKKSISEFAAKAGFKLKNIFVIDGSKRSTKANAYFTGFGAKKRIVLYDTLIDEMKTNEIVAVLAHEIGHYKKKHVITGLILSLLNTGLMLYVFSLMVNSVELARAMNVNEPSFHVGFVAFGILYSPLSFLLGMGMNIISRSNEFQADDYAAMNHDAEALSDALKKLSVKNLSNLTPHPVYVFFHYSHPPLLQRLGNLNKK